MAVPELIVNGQQVIPIRAIPKHSGGHVDVVDVAKLLSDPESFGAMTGVGLVGHYCDARGIPHPMFPYEFQEMAGQIDACIRAGQRAPDLVAYLLPGIFVTRHDLELFLFGLWNHYVSVRGCSLDRGEFEFNPAPRMDGAEATLIYSEFEDLITSGRMSSGQLGCHEDRLEDVRRVMRRLLHVAADAGIPIVAERMPGRIEELVALLKRHSRPMMALADDAVRGYINQAGYRYRPGRPRRDAPLEDPLYTLM